ncbi:MAG: DUF4390 domain-containing protein [Piscinibacter sp.]|uniref:DUF4390 domain-containing protein n=1 Tax=Piscinibacter TaxID=1114981 RepID=UPI000FDE7A8E|nr:MULTISPECIES: DUF4390 domain-containing protein [Piscinibacter]MCW5665440.1 DUF4390 domain-containing protein [Piscinibacter sp.]
MRRAAPVTGQQSPRDRRDGAARRRLLAAALGLSLAPWLGAARAQSAGVELTSLEVQRNDDGLFLDYGLSFELPRGAEEALGKSVPLYFVADAELLRSRWYWRDKRVARATRQWRIVYQPLTSNYRVTFAGISQTYTTRAEALAAIRRGVQWKIADAGQLEGGGHYLEFSFRLDTSLLPRPMQIGIGNPTDWTLVVEKTLQVD